MRHIHHHTCIDQHGETAITTTTPKKVPKRLEHPTPLYHYVIVRADLPHGMQVAQTIHAAGESAQGVLPEGTYAVALHVAGETELENLLYKLCAARIPYVAVMENAGEYDGQLMAVGICPTRDRDMIRKYVSSLPLVR